MKNERPAIAAAFVLPLFLFYTILHFCAIAFWLVSKIQRFSQENNLPQPSLHNIDEERETSAKSEILLIPGKLPFTNQAEYAIIGKILKKGSNAL